MLIRVWQYRARKDKLAEFRAEYGSSGAWVALFRGAPGYVGTDLIQSATDPLEFVTVDRWTSREAWESFLRANEPAYRALDQACEQLTDEERELKSFFDYQPFLNGDLLQLRPLRAGDFDAMFAVAADPLIWEQHPASDRYQEPVFRALFCEMLDSGGALVALDAKDSRVIGWSRFHAFNGERSEVEIGWTMLGRSHWGGQYNGEMKQLMLQHAFRFVERVVFLIGPNNIRSQRAVEKIGAVRAGTRRDGAGRESVVYEMIRG